MVKLGPDVQSGKTDAYSGYLPNGNIWGFSMMHESGTGGAPKYDQSVAPRKLSTAKSW